MKRILLSTLCAAMVAVSGTATAASTFQPNQSQQAPVSMRPIPEPSPNPAPGGGDEAGNIVVTAYDRDSLNHTLSLYLSNSLKFTIDMPSNSLYIRYHGRLNRYSLDRVIRVAAKNSAMTAAQIRDRFRQLTYRSQSVRMVKSSASNFVSSGRAFTFVGMPPNSTYNKYANSASLRAAGSLGAFRCDWRLACGYGTIDGGGHGSYGVWYWDTDDPRPPYGQDYRDWQRWKNAACDSMQDAMVESGLGFISGVLSAASSVATGFLGVAGAAVSFTGMIYGMTNVADHAKVCLSSYPGPGNW